MKRYGRLGALLACMLLLAMLVTACAGDDGDTEKGEGGVGMTEMVKQALEASGVDMDSFDAENPKTSEKSLMESAAYLENTLTQKYPGTEFEVTACIPNGLTQNYDKYVLQPAGMSGAQFTAHVTGGDEWICTDSYYGILKIADYEALVSEKIAAAEPDAQVFCTIEYQFAEKWDADAPIGDAVSDTGMYAYTWILLPPGETELDVRAAAVEKLIAETGLKGDYVVYLMTEDCGKLTKAEAFERIPANDTAQVFTGYVRFIQQ